MDGERWWVGDPEEPKDFWNVINNLKATAELESEAGERDLTGVTLTAREHQYVTECFMRAEASYEEQQLEAAWHYLGLAIEMVAYRSGFCSGRKASSDEAAAARMGKVHAHRGKAKQAEKERRNKKKAAQELLALNRKHPFKIQNQMRDAALRLSPGGGERPADQKWWRDLKNGEPALKDLYDTLSRRRKL